MSSRVQKGSTVFRPVAKSRTRTVTRQNSVASEQLRPDASINQPSSSARTEQAHIHDADSQPLPVHTGNVFVTPALHGLGEVPSVQISSSHGAPPAIPPVIVTPARAMPAPIVLGTRISGPTEPTPLSHSNPAAEPRSLAIPIVQAITPNPPQVVPTNDVYVVDGMTPSNTSSVLPRVASALTKSNSTDVQAASQSQEAGTSKTRRRRKSQDDGPKTTKKRRNSKGDNEETVRERSASRQPRSRASSVTPRPRKRAPTPPPYDPEADPGEDIDPTTMTMAALCDDTGQGRVSSKAAEIQTNHAAWKVKNREKRTRMRTMMEAKKYGRPEDDENETQETTAQDGAGPPGSSANAEAGPSGSSSAPAVVDGTGSGFDYSQDLSTSRYNVQVRIGPNGETVIDEESLIVDRVDNDGTDDYTHIVESDHTKFVNSGTYGKRFRGSRWSAEETELFYDALSQYGENYELIAYVLPGRDRKSCKNKFKVEDKKNPARINHCLDNSVPVDMKTLARMTGKDFSGPVPEIRVPPPPPMQQTARSEPESNAPPEPGPSKPTKKRSRSRSQAVSESDVVVIGNADTFEG